MKKIGLFYGPQGGNVEAIAVILVTKIGTENIELIPTKAANIDLLESYDRIIFGISSLGKDSWENDVKTDWDEFLPIVDKADLADKTPFLESSITAHSSGFKSKSLAVSK